jgi:hypothetical protein
MYHYAVNNMLKYSKDINKIYDDCLTHFSKLAIFKKSYKKTQKNCAADTYRQHSSIKKE